jgi:hypothetical protein
MALGLLLFEITYEKTTDILSLSQGSFNSGTGFFQELEHLFFGSFSDFSFGLNGKEILKYLR